MPLFDAIDDKPAREREILRVSGSRFFANRDVVISLKVHESC